LFVDFNAYFICFFPGNAETDVELGLHGQLCQECSYQKLLQFDWAYTFHVLIKKIGVL